jgi:hypothetical protein
MERFKGITVVLLITVAVFACAAAGKSANTLLQEGLYAEEVDGDLDAAIKIYQQVIDQSAAQRSYVAQAMYRQGMCYLKQQDEDRAREVFAKVVGDYGDQTRIVDKVKPLLEELSNGDPAALMPPGTLLYIEFGSPGRQVETILKMLEGTPFENPLEAIGAGGSPGSDPGGGRSTGYSGPGPENILAGLLNPSMMAEFKKIRGVGVGITGVATNHPPMLIVLYPGKSDALRGLLMMVLTAHGKPGKTIEGMQTVLFQHGGGAAFDDSVMIFASPTAYNNGQLAWCVKQHKGLTKEPTLATGNEAFSKISKKDRQENALTIWADVDEVYTALEELPPAESFMEIRTNKLIDLGSVDDLLAFLSIEEDRIAVEANIGFKDGHQSTAYNLIRTPGINKAAFNSVPSDAVALISTASPGPGSPLAGLLSSRLKEDMGLEIGGAFFSNVDQITLFALPASGEAVDGMPPIAMSLGAVISSDDPRQTRQILRGLLTAAKLLTTSGGSFNERTSRYRFDLANGAKIHGYSDYVKKATVLSLNPAVVDASVAALDNRKSVAIAGPLKNAVSMMSPATSKVALINVGGMLDFVETDENMSGLVAQLAKSCDKTTVRFRTLEEQNNLNARVEISGLPPMGEVIGPAIQLAKLMQQAKERSRAQARMAGIPAAVRPTDTPPIIDGRADSIWSEIHRQKISNTAYAPAEGREDLTAFYRAMWDQDNLYVLVNVMDDVLKNDSDEFYFDDCVEVFIDPDNSKSPNYSDNDYQYFFEWAQANPQMGESQHSRTDGVEFAVRRTDVGYRVEIRFPWSTLGTDPAVGKKIGIDVHVNDDDDGGERDTKVMWRSVEDNTWQNPRAMGVAELGGMVAWLKLDETQGRDAADSSGNGSIGKILNGMPRWQASGGKLGGALLFDGKGDWVHLANESNFDFEAEVTVAAWINVNKFDKDYQAIATKGDSAWRLQRNENTDTLEFACSGLVIPGGNQWGSLYGNSNVNDGKWHHVVGVYDGEKMYLYIDGDVDGMQPASGGISTNDEPVYIGENSEMTGRHWNGMIDDVRIYSYALSQTDIVKLYNAGK